MKRALKIVLLSFLTVIAAFGLAIGGMYLFGGFEEKEVYADNISFSSSSVVSADSFALKISTTTEGVNKNKLKLTVLAGGESVIDFPSQVNIGEVFTIKPKQVDGNNFGGNATLVAFYDEDNANPAVVAKCGVLIDVPVKSLRLNKLPFTTTPNQINELCKKDARIDTVFGINPARALMPYVEYGKQVITDISDKALYLELVDELGSSLDAKVAQFVVNDVAQQSNIVKVNYSFRDVNGDGNKEIVFDDNIAIQSKTTQSKALLNAYVYSTYKEQASNTVDGNLQLNKATTQTNNLGFTIGNYEIVDMNLTATTEEIFIKENSKIYINNPEVSDGDINLGLTLTTGSTGVEAGDYYLLNTYISVDGSDVVNIKNLNNQSTITEGLGYGVNYEGISTEKSNWGWILNIYNYKAYATYLSTGEPIVIKVKYFDDSASGQPVTFERSFNIIPKIVEVDTFKVNYPAGFTSFEVESKSEIQLSNDQFNISVRDGDKISDANDTNGDNIPDNYNIQYYLSLSENYKNGKTTISTVPNKTGTYRVKFSFVLTHDSEDVVDSLEFNQNVNEQWCEISAYSFKQNGNKVTNYLVNVPIEAEVDVNIKAIPTSDELFIIKALSSGTLLQNVSIVNYQTKFYAAQTDGNGNILKDNNNQFICVDLPCLLIDNVKYGVDFDYFYDEDTFTNYLKINTSNNKNTYIVEGIGTFYITAQVVFVEDDGQMFWLGKSATVTLDVYEDLDSITVTKYSEEDVLNLTGKFNTASVNENNFDGWMFISSEQIDALTNYINAGQVEVFAEQILDSSLLSTYTGIKDINKDTIVLGHEFIPVTDANAKVIGYKLYYSVGEVHSINLTGVKGEDLENNFKIVIRVKIGSNEDGSDNYVYAKFQMEGNVTENYLKVVVQDVLIDSATLTYNGNVYDANNPLALYANINTSTSQVYYTGESSSINLEENLKYGFNYNIEKASTTQTLTAEFTVEDKSGISLDGLYSFVQSESGQGGLTFNNFPRVNDGGVLVKMKIFSGLLDNFNTHYVWDSFTSSFKLTQNSDLMSDIYFRIYGLKIEITVNSTVVSSGVENANVNILDDGDNVENELFTITVKDGKSGNTSYELQNLQTILTTHIDKDYLFKKDNSKLVWTNGRTLTFEKDLIRDENVVFRFYVGSNSTANALKIKVNESTVTEYTQKFLSPFVINVLNGVYDSQSQKYNVEVTAPSENVNLVEYVICDENGNALTGDNLEEAKSAKIESAFLILPENFGSAGGVDDPIKINSDNTLTFKAVPLESYNVELTFALVTKNNETREVKISVTVKTALNNSDITIGTKVDGVPGESEDYYYIEAGLTQNNPDATGEPLPKEYSYKNGGIILGGVLADKLDDISSVTVSFADNYDDSVADSERIGVEKHMKSTSWTSTTKDFGLSSDDLKDEKTVIVTINVVFKDGGKFVYQKEIVVKPNITVTLDITSLSEGQEVNLLELIKKDGEEFDILKQTFEYELTDNTQGYCQNSFNVDTDVFTDTSANNGYASYSLYVKYGATTTCNGSTTIGFYYIVNNNENVYTLYFEFDVEIVVG